MLKKKPELMCPVRDWAGLEACKLYADAVYFGLPALSLRANADSLKISEMAKFVSLCHSYKIKAYLTLNSVLYEDDLVLAEKIIKQAKKAKVDALIVWDPAAIVLVKKLKVPFIISTQANVSNYKTAEFYKGLGAKRVVLAREMTLKQIKNLRKKTKVEVEVFVHGAVCVAISGRCLMSSYLYGRASNRGACSQPCRKLWQVSDEEGNGLAMDGKFLMSAKDLCMIDHVPELIKSGVNAFKIEGRRRDPRYIQVTARCYREAIDSYYEGTCTKEKVAKWRKELSEIYNRGYSTGFYFSKVGADGIGYEKADNSSQVKKMLVGRVYNYLSRLQVAEVELNHRSLKVGDKIIFEGKKNFLEEKIESMQIEKKLVTSGEKGQKIAIKISAPVRRGDKVFILLQSA